MLSIKNQTLLFITSIILLSFGTFFYLFYQYQSDELEKTNQIHFDKIKDSFEKNIERNFIDTYTIVAKKFITNDMLKAIASNDREKLLTLSKDKYNELKLDDPYLEQFHFHRKDGTTFLRLHKVEFYDDDIAKIRPMVTKVHKQQTIISGFEVGLHGFSYRIFIPLFYQDSYIGAFELGISPKKIIDVVTFFNSVDALLDVYSTKLKSKNNSLLYTNISDSRILRYLPDIATLPLKFDISYEGKNISIFSFDVPDYSGKVVAKFVFFQDLTLQKDNFKTFAKNLFFVFLLSIIIVFLIINFGFNNLISKLERSHERLQQYTKLIDETVITSTTDLNGNITSLSQAFCDVSGYSKEELIGQNHRIIKNPNTDATFYTEMWNTLLNNQIWKGQIHNLTKSGEDYWVKATISPIYNRKKEKIGYTAIRQNITDKKKVEELSITDGLTHIFNRRYFNTMFPKIINGAKRKNLLICMMILDIDFFKQYNDNYGHSKGDDVLIAVAQCLKNSLKRVDDLAFRLGGEEFAIIFTADDRTKAFEFANYIRSSIEELTIEHNFSSIDKHITVSIGLVCQRAIEIYDKETLYKDADIALYEAKKKGRNKVVLSKSE